VTGIPNANRRTAYGRTQTAPRRGAATLVKPCHEGEGQSASKPAAGARPIKPARGTGPHLLTSARATPVPVTVKARRRGDEKNKIYPW
jgi:hypothetical protein